MCGIVGLFLKNPDLEVNLGAHMAAMLSELSERGPDSAGIAVYRNDGPEGSVKFTLSHRGEDGPSWSAVAGGLAAEVGETVDVREVASHAVLTVRAPAERVRAWLARHHPEVRIVGVGDSIEIFKEKGPPREVAARFALEKMTGSHALGHTRMATESAVTTEHSHPFSTGMDLCLVHNGSLSNHNRLRRWLARRGIAFATDNDSEVAAGYLTFRLGEGLSLDEALEAAIRDLDGFYTFAVGTKEGFAVLRDPIACKPAVLAETDDWVAMASEYRSIARLPGAERASVWEPRPAVVYHWSRN